MIGDGEFHSCYYSTPGEGRVRVQIILQIKEQQQVRIDYYCWKMGLESLHKAFGFENLVSSRTHTIVKFLSAPDSLLLEDQRCSTARAGSERHNQTVV